MIGDPESPTQQFLGSDIQDTLDETRQDIRYLDLEIAPSIVNTASTLNQPSVIFADYYARFQWWESDAVLQGINVATGAAWVVLTPLASDYITGHWQFELTPFVNGTVPGQYPPIFITGKTYDLNYAAAELLEMWAATLTGAYDIAVDGQNLRRSQLMSMKLQAAQIYRRKAKPRTVKIVRDDISPELTTRETRELASSIGSSMTMQ
jgi:hypothetical protein